MVGLFYKMDIRLVSVTSEIKVNHLGRVRENKVFREDCDNCGGVGQIEALEEDE